MQENYLAKWLNNELNEKELAEFESSAEYKSYHRIIDTANTLEAPEFNSEETLTALKNKQILTETKVIQLQPFKKFMRVAAAAVVLLFAGYYYVSMLGEKVATDYAQQEEITLPDNSEVILNADSEITYSKRNWSTERKINLSGEAYFKVAKGKKFSVETDAGTVSVLGTQFHVENRENIFEVYCYEGLVSVTYDGKETKLPAGSSFVVIDGTIINDTPQTTTFPSWLKDESSFKSMPFKFVLAEFERQHNIEVATQDVNLSKLFTGSFSNTNLELALKSITIPSGIKFKLEDKKVLFYAEKAE